MRNDLLEKLNNRWELEPSFFYDGTRSAYNRHYPNSGGMSLIPLMVRARRNKKVKHSGISRWIVQMLTPVCKWLAN